ncbi:MAG: CHAP domain-containing protein [Candidatus Kapabacteria bacterium]|nr:CHAP domain-containing protein [Candidatus Kapabacteria bacterium]
MNYGDYIKQVALEYAREWRKRNCTENNTACYQYLFDEDYTNVTGKPWCVGLVSAVLRHASRLANVSVPLPFTLSTVGILDEAKRRGIRVDSTPAVGSIFVYVNNPQVPNHAGIVIGGDTTGIYTVEGNVSDHIKCYGCSNESVVLLGTKTNRSYARMRQLNTQYIHVEDTPIPVPPASDETNTGLIIAGAFVLAGGLYAAFR